MTNTPAMEADPLIGAAQMALLFLMDEYGLDPCRAAFEGEGYSAEALIRGLNNVNALPTLEETDA